MARVQVALFVEGSEVPAPARRAPPLEVIWQIHLATAADVPRFDHVIPISKKHLVAMDPEQPPMSGCSEPLDALIERQRKLRGFDAAVVAWDLVPAWNPAGDFCRRAEVIAFYRHLAASPHLPSYWCKQAASRVTSVESQTNARRPLTAGIVLALCMEPMFEALLCGDESAARRAFDLPSGVIPAGWPRAGWGEVNERHPDENLLNPAVRAVRRHRPRPESAKRVPGDLRTNKDGWGEYLLRGLLADDTDALLVRAHPIVERLRAWLV